MMGSHQQQHPFSSIAMIAQPSAPMILHDESLSAHLLHSQSWKWVVVVVVAASAVILSVAHWQWHDHGGGSTPTHTCANEC